MEHKLISHSLDHPLTLEDHIYQVCRAAKYLVSQKSLNFNGISKEQIVELCTLTALCHDFGKSTAFFQEYIKSKRDGTEYEGNTRDKSHSLISAFFGWHITEKWISRNDRLSEHWKSFLPLAVFLAIDGHHGRYESIEGTLKSVNKNYKLLERQIDRIQPEIYEYESSGFKLSDGQDFDIGTIDSISGKIRRLNRKYGKINLDIQIEHRILALFLYSILLESDKAYLASDDPKQYERDPRDIPDDLVDRYLKTLGTDGDINEERRRAYEETISNVDRFPLTERIHSITLPTGLGKTLLSASWALKLRKRIGRGEEGVVPKIIVSLPFLSIIEQTDDVYKKFLGALYEREGDRLYMPRYSISDFKYRNGIDDEERSDNSVDFFLNIWNSEIIVSTFDQLLYSLFSLKSKHLMRFHNLFNAIIVFDEIQALPSELWKPFEYFFKKLSEVGGTHILLMSATQPNFFPDAIERVPEHEKYFKNRRRVNLRIKPEKRSVDGFIENLPDLLNEHSDESMMIVLNTRDSSKSIYKKIGGMIDEKTILERPLIYLSSLVAPSQRTNRILDIKRCIEKELNPIIVTTQCIEAGVDIDVDHIVRDWGPLDSIFQVCGRCNRNGQKGTGGVEIVRLISGDGAKGRFFSDMVYDPILLDCTAFSMSGNIEIPEEQFYRLGYRYFESVRERLGKSMEIVRAYAQYTHKYGETVVNIKELLRGDERQEQFIISSLDEKLPAEIRKALDTNDRWERRYAMKGLSKRIAANSVSVRFEKWMPVRPDDLTTYPIRNFRILDEQFYDTEGVGLDVDLKNPIGGTVIC